MSIHSYRGPVQGSVIKGEHVGDRNVRPAAALYQRILGAGVVARLDLLDGALEQARQDGAAAALEALAALMATAPEAGARMLAALADQAGAQQ